MAYRPEANWLDKNNRWQINAYNEAGARKTFTSNTPGRTRKRMCQDKADEWIRLGTISASARLSICLDNYILFLKQYGKVNGFSDILALTLLYSSTNVVWDIENDFVLLI